MEGQAMEASKETSMSDEWMFDEDAPVRPLGHVMRTERGFQYIRCNDYYGRPLKLQASSLAVFAEPGTSAVWINDSHLSHGQVRSLVAHLSAWLEHRTLEIQ